MGLPLGLGCLSDVYSWHRVVKGGGSSDAVLLSYELELSCCDYLCLRGFGVDFLPS